jgi:hypothetical protein
VVTPNKQLSNNKHTSCRAKKHIPMIGIGFLKSCNLLLFFWVVCTNAQHLYAPLVEKEH